MEQVTLSACSEETTDDKMSTEEPLLPMPTTVSPPRRRVLLESQQPTPKSSLNVISNEETLMMSSLLSAPIKLTEVDELTPGKENTILGRAIQSLGINSPTTPCSSTRSTRGNETALTPVNSKKRLRQFSMDDSLIDDEFGSKKFRRSPDSENFRFDLTPKLYRSQSESAVTNTIKNAMEQQHNDPLLVGDCSRQYILPLIIDGRHLDLKEISGQTLAQVLNGEYGVKFTVIDCRYPYEYDGGHIKGAINLFTETQIYKEYFEERKTKNSSEREILIFHCEFSVERGPRMCRIVRDWDRNANISTFPALYYPEMYVLYRGYKGFYEEHPTFCVPSKYIKMVEDPEQLRLFKTKCKSEVVKTKSKSVPTIKLGRSISIKKFVL